MSKRILSLIIAVAFMLSAAALFAETSTVDAKFILDKTKVTSTDSSRYVNLSVLGLDKNGQVDLYGEQYGSTLYVVVSSTIGQLQGGGTSPTGLVGSFASDVKYYKMSQGVAKVSVYYPDGVSGTDTLNIQLMENYQAEGGGQVYKLISSTSKTITVEAHTGAVTSLTYVGATNGTSTVGAAGDTITYKAGGVSTGGCPSDNVTLYFLNQSDLSVYKTISTTLSDDGTNCIASFVIDNTFTKAGTYYLEAKDGSISSIGCATTVKSSVPTYTFTPLSTPSSLYLKGPFGVTVFADNGSAGYNTRTFTVYLLDKYGNAYDNQSSDDFSVSLVDNDGDTIATQSTNGKNYVTFNLDAYSDITRNNVSSLYATVANSDIANSDTVSITVKSYKLDNSSMSFDNSALKLSGVVAIDNNSNGYYDSADNGDVGSISIELYDVTKHVYLETVTTTTDGSGNFVAYFTKVLPKGDSCGYVIKDANGAYAPKLIISNVVCPYRNYANIKNVKIVDILGRESSCGSYAYYDSNNKVSNFVFYPYWLAFYDANGNLISDNYTKIYDDTGFQVKATTSVTANVTPSSFDNLSDGTYDNITISYDPAKYSADNVTFSFFDNQSNLNTITKEVTILGASTLAKLDINIEQTTLPLNSTVAFTVEAFSSTGYPYSASNIVMKISDPDGVNPTIKQNDTTVVYSNNVWSSFGPREMFTLTAIHPGKFTLTFESADGTVSVSKDFTVSAAYEAPTCSADSLNACTTETDCTGAGGYWYNDTCNAEQQPQEEVKSAAPEKALEASATGPATMETVEASAGDTVSIKPQLTIASGDTPKNYYAAIVVGGVAYFYDGTNWTTNMVALDSAKVSVADGVATFDLIDSAKLDSTLSGYSFDIYFGYDTGDNFAGLKFNGYKLTVK